MRPISYFLSIAANLDGLHPDYDERYAALRALHDDEDVAVELHGAADAPRETAAQAAYYYSCLACTAAASTLHDKWEIVRDACDRTLASAPGSEGLDALLLQTLSLRVLALRHLGLPHEEEHEQFRDFFELEYTGEGADPNDIEAMRDLIAEGHLVFLNFFFNNGPEPNFGDAA